MKDGQSASSVVRALLQPNIAVVVAEGFLSRLAFSVVTFSLPFYAKSLGMSLTAIGVLISLRVIVSILVKPLMGAAADRFGVKGIYLFAVAGRSVLALAFIFATVPWALFFVRGLQGITSAARSPAATLMLIEHSDSDRMASIFSWYATTRFVAMALGFPLAGFLLVLTGDQYQYLFLFAAATSAVALILVWRFAQNERSKPAHSGSAKGSAGRAPISAKDWVVYAQIVLLMAIPASMIQNLFPLIVSERTDLNKAEIGVMYSLATIAIIIMGPSLGWLADNVSRRIVLAVRSVCNIVSSLLYLLLPGFWGMTTARSFDDIGKVSFKLAWGSVLGDIARSGEKARRGRVLSYLDTAESIGEAIGPILAGLLWQTGGIWWMLMTRIGISIAAEVAAIRVLDTAPRKYDGN